jgi:hypothetical protein
MKLSRSTRSISRLALSCTLLLVCITGLAVTPAMVTPVNFAMAQSSEPDWGAPTNLSHSGGATLPRLVVDSDGRVSVLWLDEYAGEFGTPSLLAAQRVDGQWSDPVPLDLPFAGYLSSLKLEAGTNGFIHAAWTDDRGRLYNSLVRGQDFLTQGWWSAPQLVAFSVTDFDLDAAPDGSVHLAFIRSAQEPDFPAGVYALRSVGSTVFTYPTLLYASPYYRGLAAGEAHVSLAADEGGLVYAAWDEPSQERVYRAVSADSGSTWGEAQIVDRRQPEDSSNTSPSQPRLNALGQQALLIWKAGHSGGSCTQYSQATLDGGQTWSDPAPLPEPFNQTCAQDLQLLNSADGQMLAFASGPSGAYLLNWQPPDSQTAKASGWSSARPQSALSGFTHPDTFRPVSLDCRQAALSGEDLLVVGCEREKKADIWMMERPLGDPASWFPVPTPTSPWSTPVALISSPRALHSPLLLAEPSGRLHALWSRQEDAALYYAISDGTRWTQASAVLNSPGGAPENLSAVLVPGKANSPPVLFVVWSDPAAQGTYYSYAPASQALNPGDWAAPQELPANSGAASPQVLVQADGRLLVAYAVPYNEGRGLYLIESQGAPQPGGRVEWSKPRLVFDAAAAGWDSLSEPRLAESADGALNLLWTRRSLPPTYRPMGLYAARALDPQANWSTPEEVDAGQALWSQVLTAADGTLHRAWQKQIGEQAVFFHQVSQDGGASWSQAERITGLKEAAPAGLALDTEGRPNLLAISVDTAPGTAGQTVLQRWAWEEGGWRQVEGQPLPGVIAASALAVAGAPGVSLAALYSGSQKAATAPATSAGRNPQPTSLASKALFFSGRPLETGGAAGGGSTTAIPADSAAAAGATLPATPGPANSAVTAGGQTQTAAPTVSGPTPIPTFDAQPAGGLASRLGGQAGVLIFGAIPAILLIAAAFLLAARRVMRGK